MAGETAQIAEIARIVSSDIFEQFGWQRSGTSDHNFKAFPLPKVEKKSDGKSPSPAAQAGESEEPDEEDEKDEEVVADKLQDFPADVVFTYLDPFADNQLFLHFDLKSYAKGSLKARTTTSALKRLASTIAVAETSSDWREKFAVGAKNFSVHGALFVYNHDQLGESEIEGFLEKMHSKSLTIPEQKRLYVFTPRRINYLLTVLVDIKCMIGEGLLPSKLHGDRHYYYQYGVEAKPLKSLLDYATAEILLGPVLIQWFRFKDDRREGYVVHYDGTGSEEDEFVYLFEMFLKRGLLVGEHPIHLRMPNAADNAKVVMDEAKSFFVESYHDLPGFREQVDRVQLGRVSNIVTKFSTIDLGMRK